jgi:hypothetical protein
MCSRDQKFENNSVIHDMDPEKGLFILDRLAEILDGLSPEEKNKKLDEIKLRLQEVNNAKKNHLKRVK